MHRLAVVTLALLAASCGRRTIRDHLTAPIRIVSAKADTLVLADGSSRNVPGIQDLVTACPSLDAVEVRPDGTLFGLVRTHRTCGNDPITVRDEKVPIVPMIAILRENGAVRHIKPGMIDVDYLWDLVRACGGTIDDHTGATFPGE